MIFSQTPPTENGYYWYKKKHNYKPSIAHVKMQDGWFGDKIKR
jgi:hypothetical protein